MLLTAVNNGYWYDHGTELVVALLTLIGLGIALWNSGYTMSKDRKNKEEDDRKTIYMLDLITAENRQSLLRAYNRIHKAENKRENAEGYTYYPYADGYFGRINAIDYPTIKEDLVKLYRKKSEFNPKFLNEVMTSYRSALQNTLTEQYSSLYFDSIKNIEDKIEEINTLQTCVSTISSSKVNAITATMISIDTDKASKVSTILNHFKDLESCLDKVSKSLYDNTYPTNESEENKNE